MSEDKFKQIFLYLPTTVQERVRPLNNGSIFPMITFGTSHIEGYENIYNAVNAALEVGYRSFECEPNLNQEEYLGESLKELLPAYHLKRSDVFLIGKLFPRQYGHGSTEESLKRTCSNLKTNYLDLYLMQWPGGYNVDLDSRENLRIRQETWGEMSRLHGRGFVKNIGVCNFEVKHLEHLRSLKQVDPAVNQVEFHIRWPQTALLNYCKERNILLQAISFKDTFHPLVLNDNTLKLISRQVGKNPVQVLLRWILNKGVAVVPQSEKPKTIRHNFEVYDFVLERPEMCALNGVTAREKYLVNPVTVI